MNFSNFGRLAAAVAAGAMLASCSGQSSSMPPQPLGMSPTGKSIAERNHWVPRYVVMKPRNVDYDALRSNAKPAALSIPFYNGSVKSPLDGRTYQFSIVGKDPRKSTRTTTVHYVPIVLVVTFSDGTVLDPTKPGCNDTVSVADRFFKGPNFKKSPLVSNGVHVGKVQIADAFQRAEFWNVLRGQNKKFHIELEPATKNEQPIVVQVNAPTGSTTEAGVCTGQNHNIGEIPINAYDNIVVGLANQYATPSEVPIVLSYNVFETEGGCCVLGYHNAYGRASGTQTYAVGAYNDAGIFGSTPIEDIHAWTHEIGELINDPFVGNPTPAWGHVGQVSGCQGNFEVGDPLTGTAFTLKYKGFTYHPQELAFFDWFYRTPSNATGGLYSFEGTFTAPQAACH